MPSKSRAPIGSGFAQVQRQAEQLLANLRDEIRAEEAALRRLKEEETKLSPFLRARSYRTENAGKNRRCSAPH
jgi:hypothetical protein